VHQDTSKSLRQENEMRLTFLCFNGLTVILCRMPMLVIVEGYCFLESVFKMPEAKQTQPTWLCSPSPPNQEEKPSLDFLSILRSHFYFILRPNTV